jgi:hypothetical protein
MAIVDIDTRISTHLPLGTDSVPHQFGLFFLDVFKKGFKGNARKKLADGVDNKSQFNDGLLLRNSIHYKPTPVDGNLQQTLNELQTAKENLKNKVRYIITYDGTMMAARDLVEGDSIICSLSNLNREFTFFSVLYGEPRYVAAEENKADQDAAIALSKVYSALKTSDPEWASEHGHDVNTFMTRLLFCLFAEDTDLFKSNLFTTTLVSRGGRYGEHAQSIIGDIYRILNTSDTQRDCEPEWLCEFPYVNGDVFALDGIHIPKFNIQAFHYLKEAGETIDWKDVHPDILGSAIQKITDPAERHSLGMHYTSVTNIDKLLGPLFVDELRESRVKANASGVRRVGNLQKLITRIGQIKVFDPACGSGNFLVIAYKRLRELEIQLLNDLQDSGVQQIDLFSQITLENFYGIEYADFAAETAKISLRIAEQQMDTAYGKQFNKQTVCLPLRSAPNIHTGSALTVDWEIICPATNKEEVYVCGNPPYLGFKERSEEQTKEQMRVFGKSTQGWGNLDYVSNWFYLAHKYSKSRNVEFAFVSTNSIVQGSHVPTLWPLLLKDGMAIKFAYTSFKWSNLAGRSAGVSCVIVGISNKKEKEKTIFSATGSVKTGSINAYLMAAVDVIIQKHTKPLSSELPKLTYGSSPLDGETLRLTPEDRLQTIKDHPESSEFIVGCVGSQELLKGIERYCLMIPDEKRELAEKIPFISNRMDMNKSERLSSRRFATQKLSEKNHSFGELRYIKSSLSILIPIVSSGERKFLPVGALEQQEVALNSSFVLNEAEYWHMAVLSSTLHRCWLDAVGGKLKGDYRYSNTLVWNTFPLPELNDEDKQSLNKAAQKIINARHYHPDLTLGDMYNPGNMGPELLAAHKENDRALEKIFRDKPFKNDEDRLAHLFERYAEMTRGDK